MANTSSTPTIHVILNIMSIIATAVGTLLSFLILAGVLLRKKTFHNVPLILSTNNYILVFLVGIFELIDTLTVLRGDLGLIMDEGETAECEILAYILFSLLSTVYLACVLQAIFRLCRIVYPTYVRLIETRTYLMVIPLMWTFSFILLSPLYIWHGQKLIPGEYICRVSKDNAFSIAYSTLAIYGIPFNVLAFTYFQVHRFLRRQTALKNFTAPVRARKQHRDVLVFRRIVIVVALLGSYGIPISVMMIMLAITKELVPSFYRILEMSFAALILTLSIALIYVDPQLRQEIKICGRRNRVIVIPSHQLNCKRQPVDQTELKTIPRAL